MHTKEGRYDDFARRTLETAPAVLGRYLAEMPLVAILRWITPDETEAVAAAVIEAGFRLLEVPLNSPQPYDSIERLVRRFGDRAMIGAGTVMTPDQVDRVIAAGGRMIVMPHADVRVIRAAHERGLTSIPGVATPTEGFAALDAGADALKMFPAEAIGPDIVKAWRAVFATTIPLLPTGGIRPETMKPYLDAGASGFGIGGQLYAPGRSAEEAGARARAFIKAWRLGQGGEHSK